MTTNPRLSHASFGNSRQYMFCAGGEMLYIKADDDMLFDIRSNLSPETAKEAADWIQETVFDLATLCKVDPDVIHDLIYSAINRK